jgi:hypothetical protein
MPIIKYLGGGEESNPVPNKFADKLQLQVIKGEKAKGGAETGVHGKTIIDCELSIFEFNYKSMRGGDVLHPGATGIRST